jgi:hypothetical protein
MIILPWNKELLAFSKVEIGFGYYPNFYPGTDSRIACARVFIVSGVRHLRHIADDVRARI